MDRRAFGSSMLGATIAAASSGKALAAASSDQPKGSGKERLQVGMIIFDGMTNQDFVGPHDFFAGVRAADVHVLAKTREPVTTDRRLRVLPHMALSEAPDLDILFIGGGAGSTKLMNDAEVISFVATQGQRARYVTSVCSGALVLGAAGLLRGYKATTHWAAMDVLPLLGATPVHQRVVFDRNRITGGGVTAGIDFAMAVIAAVWGEEQARILQLAAACFAAAIRADARACRQGPPDAQPDHRGPDGSGKAGGRPLRLNRYPFVSEATPTADKR
jgi:cyclohexyl-isocyanide hydratase